jgi:AcrR family transcriptional regulator
MHVHIGGPVKRVRRSGVERRDQIALAGLAIIDEQGTGALNVASVARRVGVAPSALYRHFPDKDGMVAHMIARLGAGIRANLERAAAEADDDAIEALRAFLDRHVAFIQENRGFPMLVFSDLVLQHAGRRRTMLGNFAHFRDVIAGMLRLGQRQGRVRADLDPEAGAFAFFGLFMPVALDWHLSGGGIDLADTVRRAWSIYAVGIRVASKPRPRARVSHRVHRQEKRS